MPKFIKNINREIHYAQLNLSLLERRDCTDEENEAFLQMLRDGHPLPPDIYRYEKSNGNELDEFYRINDPRPTEEELRTYLSLKRYEELRAIRRCLVILIVLGALGLTVGLWILSCL